MQNKRSLKIERKQVRSDGAFEIAISTETPYLRFFGFEILRHSKDAIDMSRFGGDAVPPLLLDHDTTKFIGAIEDVRIDADNVMRGFAKFSRSQLGQDVKADVEDGLRTQVSVGYFIEEIEEIDSDGRSVRTLTGDQFERELRSVYGDQIYEREMERSRNGESAYLGGLAADRAKNDAPPTWVVKRWVPFEATICAVAADVKAGVGRSAGVESAPQAAPAAPQQDTKQPLIIVENRKMENQKTPAELEIERRDGIAALGQQYAKYVSDKEVADFVRSGKSVEMFKDFIIGKMESRHTDTSGIQIGMTKEEAKRFSLGRALVASITGDWSKAGFERECSMAVAQAWGRTPEGFFIPADVFRRDFNVGTASEAGNLVATDLRGDMYVDALRNAMVMGQLGVRYLTGLSSNVDLPRKATAGTLGMLTEIGSASETAPATAKATLSPKRIGAYVEVSKQALIQSAMSLENMIRDDLVTGAAVLLENQCINGAGTGAEIRGLRNVTGIGTVVGGTNGLAPAWSHFVDLESACANANAEPDARSGYLLNTKTRGKLKQTQFATNLPFIWQNGPQPVNGYRAAVSNNVPSNLTKGTSTTVCSAALFGSDWSMVTVGLFGAPDVVVDPYTKADTGQVKITLNQFADMAHRQPATTAKIDDLLA